MLLLDITIVNVALPSIQRRLHAGLTGLQWVVDAYALTLAALILTAGALADRYGRRLVFMVGVVVFSSASLLCGLAWNIAVLDIARALQGIGGAALFATGAGADRGRIPRAGHRRRDRGLGSHGRSGGRVRPARRRNPHRRAGLALGVLRQRSGGRLRDVRRADQDGRVARPAGAQLRRLGAAHLLGGALPDRLRSAARQRQRLDSALIVGSLAGGAVLLAVFVVVERRQPRPMLDMSLFRVPAFVGVSVATFCIGAGMFALFPYLSIYFQDMLGYSPLGAGLLFLPLTVFVFAVPLTTRKLAPGRVAALAADRRPGARRRRAGADVRADAELAAGPRSCPASSSPGIGIGLANPAIAAAALRAVDPSRTGMASGINNTCRLSGVAVGVAALGAILERRGLDLARRDARPARPEPRRPRSARPGTSRRRSPGARPSGHGRFRQRPEHDPAGRLCRWSPSARSPRAS